MPLTKNIKIILAAILMLIGKPLSAQVGENHIGLRGGIHSGVYYQNLVAAGNAERSFYALLSANFNSARITVMKITYETSLSEIADNLFFTWGYGGHVGFTITDHTYFLSRKYQFEYERFRPLIGMDGWGGLEYRFIGIPMTIGLNIKPFFEIMVPGFIKIQPADVGLSFAYRF
ncbi:MAG: hypothetical protein K8R35_07180 [Bacteroidales bacterium]|nr:hypothetical protein [Bacteroidales bacterium]